MIRRLLRPLRLGLGKLGLKVTMLKNPGERGYTGFNTEWRGPSPEKFRRCGLATFKHEGRDIRFLIQDEDDIIQQELIAGRFYEPEELAIIARHFTGGTFVDVGANIGNHAAFAGVVLRADRVIAFEPNPLIADFTAINLRINDFSGSSTFHQLGLSDEQGTGSMRAIAPHNIGATRLDPTSDGSGDIALATGDAMLADETPTFIKIDTEGAEVRVLRGLAETLARCRPAIFIEVQDEQRQEVDAILAPLGYRVVDEFARYPGLSNYMYVCEGGRAAA